MPSCWIGQAQHIHTHASNTDALLEERTTKNNERKQTKEKKRKLAVPTIYLVRFSQNKRKVTLSWHAGTRTKRWATLPVTTHYMMYHRLPAMKLIIPSYLVDNSFRILIYNKLLGCIQNHQYHHHHHHQYHYHHPQQKQQRRANYSKAFFVVCTYHTYTMYTPEYLLLRTRCMSGRKIGEMSGAHFPYKFRFFTTSRERGAACRPPFFMYRTLKFFLKMRRSFGRGSVSPLAGKKKWRVFRQNVSAHSLLTCLLVVI